MENHFELADGLERLIKVLTRAKTIVDGVITGVNDDFTCSLTILGTPYSSVPLNVLIGSQASIYAIPVIGTSCLVCFRDGDQQRPQILMVDQVDKLLINCQSLVQFNGGELGGMVKVEDLVTRLNNIENWINQFIPDFESHTHILALTAGTGTAAPTVTVPPSALTPTERSDIENTDIQQ